MHNLRTPKTNYEFTQQKYFVKIDLHQLLMFLMLLSFRYVLSALSSSILGSCAIQNIYICINSLNGKMRNYAHSWFCIRTQFFRLNHITFLPQLASVTQTVYYISSANFFLFFFISCSRFVSSKHLLIYIDDFGCNVMSLTNKQHTENTWNMLFSGISAKRMCKQVERQL